MQLITNIGTVPWTNEDIIRDIDLFTSIYRNRPIKENRGGMRSPHAFASWFMIRQLKPEYIVESGVWLGQGTWLFENAAPSAKLICIEPDLERIEYKSKKATYYRDDFAYINWEDIPKENALLFFDDHQDGFERLKIAKKLGFKHIIFEDNYPASQGDCYSLKKIFMKARFKTQSSSNNIISSMIKKIFGKHSGKEQVSVEDSIEHIEYLKQNLQTYYEFPPLFKSELTRWGDKWNEKNYPTKDPIFKDVTKPNLAIFKQEAINYTWMCYVKLV